MRQQDIAESLGAEAATEEARMVALLHDLYDMRATRNALGKLIDSHTAEVKQWMELNGRTELVDGEHNLHAWLHDREGWEWDLRNSPRDLVAFLQELGILRVDNTAFDAIRKAAPATLLDEAAKYRRKVITSTALEVKELKE